MHGSDPTTLRRHGDSRSVTISSTATFITGGNERRIGIRILNAGSTRVTVDNESSVTDGNGHVCVNTQPALELDIWRHGNLVKKPFWGITPSGTQVISVIESEDGA